MHKKLICLFSIIIISILILTGCSFEQEKPENYVSYKYSAETKSSETRLNSNVRDSFENDDSINDAKTILVNEEAQEHNFYDDATDWVKFTAQAGTLYTIETNVYEYADTILYLTNSSSVIKKNDDKSSNDYGSKIEWEATSSGTFYICTKSYNDKTGYNRGYYLSIKANISPTDGDEYENDDSYGNASLISKDETQSHDFFDDATDWVKVNCEGNNKYTIETFVQNSADTVVTVYNSNLSQITTNDDKENGNYGSLVQWETNSNGIYYIKIASYNNRYGENREYTVNLSVEGNNPNPNPTHKKWTFLVYLGGDNNLSSYADGDVEEMMEVGSSDDVNILVLWDNSNTKHGYYYIENGEYVLLEDLGEINMGDPQTAKNFINYAVENFPADKYAFSYWNHGGAVDRSTPSTKGVCWDDTNNHDHLSELEQSNIMEYFTNKIGKKLELIGFDACLMATAEIIYQYKDYANYLVASEENEPGYGWDYDFLQSIVSNPNANGDVLAQAVLDSYSNFYGSYDKVTFSAIDLSSASQLGSALNTFGNAAMNSGISGSTFKSLSEECVKFGYDPNRGTYFTRDLYQFMKKIYNHNSMPYNVKQAAQDVMNGIENLLIDEWHSSNFNYKAYGISITMKPDTNIYSQLDICIDTSWDEFCDYAGFVTN